MHNFNFSLDSFETETFVSILQEYINQHKFAWVTKELSKSELQWYLSHAEYVSQIKEKILKGHTNGLPT